MWSASSAGQSAREKRWERSISRYSHGSSEPNVREAGRESRRGRGRDFKELAHRITRAGRSEIWAQQAGDSGKVDVTSWCEFFFWKPESFFLRFSSTDWDPLALSRVIYFTQILLIQMLIKPKKCLTTTSRLVFDQTMQHCSLAKLTLKIKHYSRERPLNT